MRSPNIEGDIALDKRAIILLSGGLDSTTVLAIAKDLGYRPLALSFDYGQRHKVELEKAREIARTFDVAEHRVVSVDLKQFGGSALTDDIDVPVDREEDEMSAGIPVTYVPARNTIFLSYALAYAEIRQARDIFIGVNAVDYSGYPDCRPEFIQAFENLANLATKAGVDGESMKIHAPLIHMTKAEIIKKGLALGVDYGLTHSCYQPAPDGTSCGRCDSCRLRRKGFLEADAVDPLNYAD